MAGAAGSPERAAGAGSEPRSAELCDRPSLRQRAAPEARYRAGGHDALLLVARGSQKISRSRVAALRKVAAARVCDVVWAGRGEPSRAVSAVWDQSDDWLPAAGTVSAGGRGGSGGSLASPAALAGPHRGGDGGTGAGGS